MWSCGGVLSEAQGVELRPSVQGTGCSALTSHSAHSPRVSQQLEMRRGPGEWGPLQHRAQ